MRTTLQVTVVNGLNNDGLGDIVRFAIENIDKIHSVLFQPVMFTGRDECISSDDRYAKRYPLSQLAYDLQEQGSTTWRPTRDWFPISDYGIFAHLCDVLNPNAELGSLFPDTHPNHGIFSLLLIDADQKAAVPIPSFFNLEQFMRDILEITDRGRGPASTRALVSLSILRNFNQQKAPVGFGLAQVGALLKDCFYRVAGSGDDWSQKAYSYKGRWKVMIVNGLWFQDPFNYDFSAISNSSIPVATRQGEISFCAYNGGGWRKVVEHMNQTATLAEWYRSHPRHEIYAKGKNVDLAQTIRGKVETSLVQIEAAPMPPSIAVL
jgi:7,8-dihydro-6-hydroxymethylpterin dimethyltransferase